MKIENKEIAGLRQEQLARRKSRGTAAFASLLQGEVGSADAAAVSGLPSAKVTASRETGDIDPFAEGTAASDNWGEDLVESIGGVLDELDAYAASLAAPQSADLKTAYGLLENMDKNIASLRERAQALDAAPGMASLVDEIAVLTTAQTVKLNRGDYNS